jgi:hypothetical protein
MASKRKYGYYIKGNKIALIEEGTGSGICSLSGYSSQTTCEDAGGTWTENAISTNDGEYRSPVATVTDGLEIQYAYSSNYLTPSKRIDSATADTYHSYNCWFIVDGYLTLGASGVNFSSFSSIAVDSYILIEGSERWNGIHKVKEIQNISNTAHGGIQTYTKVNQATKYFTDNSVAFTTGETMDDVDNEFDDIFSASPSSNEYMWIAGSDAGAGFNNGLYSGWSYSGSTITFSSATFYYIGNHTETTMTPSWDASADSGVTIYIYEAFRENGSAQFYSGVDVMDDETFELDISRYQANAVVYYLKAKLAEDGGDMEMREFFMREFKRQLEKSTSALKRGPYMVQGFKEMR